MSDPLLKLQNLSTQYEMEAGVIKAVDNVDLSIQEDEVIGLLGESGCGKSTLGLSIPQLVPSPGKIVNGSIFFHGSDLLQKSYEELRKIRGNDISMIFQDPTTSLDPLMKVGPQIMETIMQHKEEEISKKVAKRKAHELFGEVNLLPDRFSSYPHQLSGGMKQRVMIAIALALNPDLIIADEPTSSLDVAVQAQILDLMEKNKEQYGLSMLFITHNAGLVAEIADRVALMYAGKIFEVSEVHSFFEDPLHPYAKKLIETVPDIQAMELSLDYLPGSPPDLTTPPKGCRFHPRCPSAMEKCKREASPMFQVGDRLVKCFLYEEGE